MNFERYSQLEGKHALFSPSQPSWLRYDDAKLFDVFSNKKAAEYGTRLHAWAKETIDLGIKLPKNKKTLNMYVNDAIDLHMDTEVVLRYSDRFFGTADAISFHNNKLRIHDLKTGKSPVHDDQVLVYAALFCLQYMINPYDIDIELRIYQNDEEKIILPKGEDVTQIMDIIQHHDALLEQFEREQEMI